MSQLNRLNLANFLFHCARMFSGAVFVILLLDRGISLELIALAKGCQLIVSSFLVVPLGTLSDKYGSKSAVMSACLFSLIYYLCLMYPSSSRIIIGEICNGIALAAYTGAFESWVFSLVEEKHAIQLHIHLAKARELSYCGIICGGLFGAWLSDFIFPLSFLVMLASIGIFLLVRNNRSLYFKPKEYYFPSAVRSLISQKVGIFLILAFLLVGGGMQLIYQFWQPFFLKFQHFQTSKANFGYLFVAFMLTQYLVSRLTRRRLLENTEQLLPLVGLFWLAAGIFLLGTIKIDHLYVACSCFCLFQGLIAAAGNMLIAYLGEFIEERIQSTVISILDLAGKSLGTCFLFFGESLFTISQYDYGWLFLVIALFILFIYTWSQKKKLAFVNGS